MNGGRFVRPALLRMRNGLCVKTGCRERAFRDADADRASVYCLDHLIMYIDRARTRR